MTYIVIAVLFRAVTPVFNNLALLAKTVLEHASSLCTIYWKEGWDTIQVVSGDPDLILDHKTVDLWLACFPTEINFDGDCQSSSLEHIQDYKDGKK